MTRYINQLGNKGWPSLLLELFKAGNTDDRMKMPFPKAPSTKLLETPPTYSITNDALGLANAQTSETSARL